MKNFLIALQFLTILPVKINSGIKESDFGKALLYFPLVGILIGFLLALASIVFAFLPNLVTGSLLIIILIVISGGIHLDGLCDTCDGFYGLKPKQDMLNIMRDSRTGVMGVIGVVTILLLKFTLIVSIPGQYLCKSLIIMAVFSRWSQAFACYASSYARKDGKAKDFIDHAKRTDIAVGGAATLIIFLIAAQLKGIAVFVSALICVFLFIRYSEKKIGGMTGDTIGALSEISEASVLFFILIYL